MPELIAISLSVLAITVGIGATEIGAIWIILRALLHLSMIFWPDLWVWAVPGRAIYSPAPEEFVIVFGWAGIIWNLPYVILNTGWLF